MDGINNNIGILKKVIDNENFIALQKYFQHHALLDFLQPDEFGRKLIGDSTEIILKEYSNLLLPKVKKFFKNNTILPSYSLFAEYSAETISLYRHKDANACTYTLDLVLYQNEPWDIYIEGQRFSANENEAVLFMGEEMEHWRDTKNNNKDKVGVIFFHYVQPNHWWFTEGPNYVETIRKDMIAK